MAAGAATPGADAVGIDTIGCGICPKEANGAFNVLYLCREFVLGCQTVINGSDEVTSGGKFRYLCCPGPNSLIAFGPAATMYVHHCRYCALSHFGIDRKSTRLNSSH